MSDNHAIDIKRKTPLRKFHSNARGEQHLGGRWSRERIAQHLIENRHKKFTLDDLARFVYGTTSPKYLDNVRKHIPLQRSYMLNKDTPFITGYGSYGRVQYIKFYDRGEIDDGMRMREELDRAVLRKDMSTERHAQLVRILALPPPLQAI